jgi:hypothetical protein
MEQTPSTYALENVLTETQNMKQVMYDLRRMFADSNMQGARSACNRIVASLCSIRAEVKDILDERGA